MPGSSAEAKAPWTRLPYLAARMLWRRRRSDGAPGGSEPPHRSPPARAAVTPEPSRLAPGEAFTPSRPKLGRRQLVGRQAELVRITQALREDHAHVVLYSERGRGKTSLANNVIEQLRQDGVIVARHTCEAESSFDSVMRGLARDLPAALLTTPVNSEAGEGCEAAFPAADIRPRDVVSLMSRLNCRALVFAIDEFDRIADAAALTRVADAIKQLSDRGAALSLMIVGVSENLEHILARHPSIQRNLVAVQLPLLTDGEVCAIIEKGGQQSGFTFSAAATGRIALLARGNPYMAQLLGLRLAQAAAARGDTTVAEQDLSVGVARMVSEAPPHDAMMYSSLTANGRDREMIAALRHLAAAEQDVWGSVELVTDTDGGVALNGRRIAAGAWARIQAAAILRPVAPGSGLYTFKNRSLMHYVLLLAARALYLPVQDPQADEPANDKPRVHLLALRG